MRSLLFLLLLPVLAGCSSKVETQPEIQVETQPETQPETQVETQPQNQSETSPSASTQSVTKNNEVESAAFKVEYKSPAPIDAVRNMFEGVVDGNIEQAKAAVVLDDDTTAYLMSNIALIRAMDDFARADNEYFGAEGAMPVGLMRGPMLSSVDNTKTVFIDDTHAECTVKMPNSMKMVKRGDDWKIDFTGPESAKFLEQATEVFGTTAKMFDQIRAGILDKTLKSREACRQEMKRLKAKYRL